MTATRIAAGAALVTICAATVTAQTPARPAPAPQQTVGVRGFADIGATKFSASKSFEAVLGSATGTVFGGGGEVVLPANLFVGLRASRFRQTGERVFVSGDDQFPLGIETSVAITPLDLTGGYRLVRPRWRIVPYGGGGVSWYRYEETSEFATDAENVSERFTGFHVLGGVEFRIARWMGAAGEAQWASVPDALGQDPNGVSSEFGETNLGGTSFRIKLIIGR